MAAASRGPVHLSRRHKVEPPPPPDAATEAVFERAPKDERLPRSAAGWKWIWSNELWTTIRTNSVRWRLVFDSCRGARFKELQDCEKPREWQAKKAPLVMPSVELWRRWEKNQPERRMQLVGCAPDTIAPLSLAHRPRVSLTFSPAPHRDLSQWLPDELALRLSL